MPRTAAALVQKIVICVGAGALALCSLTSMATAFETIREAQDPRGLFWDSQSGYLYYTDRAEDRVSRWKSGDPEPFVSTKSCGPTAIARADKTFVIACHVGGYLLVVDASGRELQRVVQDADGHRLSTPYALAGDGHGVYVVESGAFSTTAPATGVLYYWKPGGKLEPMVTGFRYPAGVVLDQANSRLLVSEQFGQQILSFPVMGPGDLDAAGVSVFADIGALLNLGNASAGPQGLAIDEWTGTIYAAIYGDGFLAMFQHDGKMLGGYLLPMQLVSGVVFPKGSDNPLFVSGVDDELGDRPGFIAQAFPDFLITMPSEEKGEDDSD